MSVETWNVLAPVLIVLCSAVAFLVGQRIRAEDIRRVYRQGLKRGRARADFLGAEVARLRDQLASVKLGRGGFDGEATKVGDSPTLAGVGNWDDETTDF